MTHAEIEDKIIAAMRMARQKGYRFEPGQYWSTSASTCCALGAIAVASDDIHIDDLQGRFLQFLERRHGISNAIADEIACGFDAGETAWTDNKFAAMGQRLRLFGERLNEAQRTKQ